MYNEPFELDGLDEIKHDIDKDLDSQQDMAKDMDNTLNDPKESLLAQHYRTDPSLFSSSQRKSKQRSILKIKTGWSDEQIEGWAKMLEFNVRFSQTDSILKKDSQKRNKIF